MRALVLLLAVAAAALAQEHGGTNSSRGRSPAVPPAPAVPARPPAPVRPAIPGRPAIPPQPARPGFAPGYVTGYAPVPYPYTAAPYPYAPDAPPPDPGPAPAYYGADPSGQGYPTILVNPNYTPQTANPVMRDYSYLPPADAAPQSAVVFLIAMKNHVIYPAVAYWVENNTLNYISQQGRRTQVPLDQVDRDFSTQLNKERNVDFGLPAVTMN